MLSRVALSRTAQRIPKINACQKRGLHLHEYQAKQLLANHGVHTQQFQLVEHVEDVQKIMESTSLKSVDEWVVKAQVHAGGRGRGVFDHGFRGGVHLTKEPKEVEGLVGNMLGHRLVTKQTAADGVLVQKVMIAEALPISKEYYLAILMDRVSGGPVIVASPQGGMDIEQVASDSPDQIHQLEIQNIDEGPTEIQLRELMSKLSIDSALTEQFQDQIKKLYALFLKVDATQVEINPLGLSGNDRVVAFDAKINFDDNAAYRQPTIFSQRDISEEDPREIAAQNENLNYIGLDGDIGCLVNGAGLAMATLDLLSLHEGRPANFLDLGGGASRKQVTSALELILNPVKGPDGQLIEEDKPIKCVLVNIFGGIVKCDEVAHGLVNALRSKTLRKPLPPVVVRLSGTNMDEAKRVLEDSKLPIVMAGDLEEAAKLAVKYARETK